MNDDNLDKLLGEWASKKLPSPKKRKEMLDQVLHFAESEPTKRSGSRLYRGGIIAAIALMAMALMFFIVLIPHPEQEIAVVFSPQSFETVPIRLSLLVLRRQPGSETAVEILEDTVITTKDQEFCELSVGGRKLFFWIYALEPDLYTFDLGTDQSSETGIVAGPDQTQAVRLRSNGDEFDVFVSVL